MKQKKSFVKRVMSLLMAAVLVLTMAGTVGKTTAKAGAINTYLFDTTTIPSAGVSDKQEIPEETTFGDGFYTIKGSVMQRLTGEGLTKCIELSRAMTGALEFEIKGYAVVTLKVSSNGTSNTSLIALVDATSGENGDVIANEEGVTEVSTTSVTKLTYNLTKGVYRVVAPESAEYDRGVRIFSIEVSESMDGPIPPRISFDKVSLPKFKDVVQNGASIDVGFTGVVGYDGADYVEVVMTSVENPELTQTLQYVDDCEEGVLSFNPPATGSYTFDISAVRAGLDPKKFFPKTVDFVLPMVKARIATASSTGDGNIKVTWGKVAEADGYRLFCDGEQVADVAANKAVVSGLEIDKKYSFTVLAYRGDEEGELSDAVSVVATAEPVVAWGFTRYGSSTNDENNGYEGSVEDGAVTVYSEGGKGKIVPNSTDGLAFYYTEVPSNMNFTLKTTAHVDSWTFSNGQDGFGIMAADRLGDHGVSTAFWNNQYMAVASKIEYFWDRAEQKVSDAGDKYTMKLGLGVIAKTGVTQENLPLLSINDTATVNEQFHSQMTTLETAAPNAGMGSGTYNIVGNVTNDVEGNIAAITDFTLEIQKNNTGYFVTYYDAAGEILSREKFYEPDALSQADPDSVYVGFFAARNARVTFENTSFVTIKPEEDAPAEERPMTEVNPFLNVVSAKYANTQEYTLALYSNVDGALNVDLEGSNIVLGAAMKAGEKTEIPVSLPLDSENKFAISFAPDAATDLGEYVKLANTDEIKIDMTVDRSTVFEELNTIYVAPNGKETGSGQKDDPVSIYMATRFAMPGQTIVLAGGTYSLSSTVRVERGVNGLPGQPIRMVADPQAQERPVFDFGGNCAGFVLGGDDWYFYGFDCTNSQNGQKGIQVSGDRNVLDQVNAYNNGNTGIQISRLYSTDLFGDWPADNLILNCTSYCNADSGYEDADGFAAKLTIGNGNVFDGCLAYNNADDGWDLFAKVETGSIGSVTIRNSVAYGNGYLADGTNAGNGNGFKMGGDSLSGYHRLENSVAFGNKAKGIDSNSCPDIQVENSTSYNNESYNVAFYTNNAANTDFAATGILSVKNSEVKSGLDTAEQFKPVGSQDKEKYLGDSNYYWDGKKSANASGAVADESWFVSTEFTGITRNPDGTLNMNGFLELTDAAAAGAHVGGTPSAEIVILENGVSGETEPNATEEVSEAEDGSSHGGTAAIVGALLCSGSALAVAVSRKKKAQPEDTASEK